MSTPSVNTSRPKAAGRQRPGPAVTADEHIGFNGRFAAVLTKSVGSMWVDYFTTLFVLAWMALATFGPLHTRDPYPFPFLLFMG